MSQAQQPSDPPRLSPALSPGILTTLLWKTLEATSGLPGLSAWRSQNKIHPGPPRLPLAQSKGKVLELLNIPNTTQELMTRDFPATAERIFSHVNGGPSEGLLEWQTTGNVNFSKLSDAEDLGVRGKLPRLSFEDC